MDNIQAKFKTWVKLIQSEKLQFVIDDIQMNIYGQHDNKLNRNIFKLLLYLSHTASKCNKQGYETAKEIAKLTKVLCSLLIKTPIDDNNYFISLYHIIRCLLALNLYEDAADICYYLQPENSSNLKSDASELLIKISYLWHTPINDMYLALSSEPLSSAANYNNLKYVIKCEIKTIQIAYKDPVKHIIKRLNTHLDKVATITEIDVYFYDFCKYILECLTETQLCLGKDDKYKTYYCILRIMCRIICRTINTTHIEKLLHAIEILDKLSCCFKNFLAEDEECYQCLQQFQNLYTIFLMSVENFVSDNAKDMQNIIQTNLEIAQKYGYFGGLMWNAYIITEIIEALFIYWETCIKAGKQYFLDSGLLLETMNLVLHMSMFFTKQVLIKCKSCQDKECTVKRDIYNAVVIKCRCINLVSKFPIRTLPKSLCTLARKILEGNLALIHEMRKCKCKQWEQLWSTCGTLIYNMGLASEHIYEESVSLFSLLCTCIFQFEKMGSECKYLALENPISSVLHRLCSIYYNNDMYEDAMTASALNALLTYDQPNTKAFHMWTNIKKKCASEKIAKLSILECLRNDKDKINKIGLSIDTSKYDLIQLCSREVKSLLEERITFTNGMSAVLDELKKLKLNDHQYAQVIQLLGHYLLDCEYDSSILQYYRQAISDLQQDKLNSIAVLCLEASLSLFMFVEELHIMNKQTHMEMENAKFALYAPKLLELRETKSPNVVPAYTMINIKKDSNLEINLRKSLEKWKQLFTYDINEVIKDWEPNLILDILITAGEYSRLYRYEDCEVEAWMLAYRLASIINDHYTIIYVTGRSISLRQINYDWIITAKEHARKHKDSKDQRIIDAIAILWINLADFYFEHGKCNDARELLTEARNLPKVSFLFNTSVYLLSLDTVIRNYNLYEDNIQHEDYGSYIVESLYAMINLNQDQSTKRWRNQAERLFSYDVLFTTTVNLSVRVNSLLSFREISAHLVRRVKTAQSLGAVIRTAELLKSLCYIDLSRLKLEDCEVKLQGLEHILDIETFQLSMNFKASQTSTDLAVTPMRITDPIRDVFQQDTSPILGKKIFDLPKFTLHTDCICYKCGNLSYQYLVFITTYIRAQLYALQNNVGIAFEHFHGAFRIRQKLFAKEEVVSYEKSLFNEIYVKRHSWQVRFYIADYVQLLIDFYYFFTLNVASRQQDALDIANLAMNICLEYKLEGHPIYITVKELVFNNDLQSVSESPDYLEFMVPQPYDIDISNYTEVPDQNICMTPFVQNHHTKKLISVRHRRSPLASKLTKVSMVLSDDEDSDTSTPPTVYSSRKPKTCVKLVRRKILENNSSNINLATDKPISTERKSGNRQTENRSIRNKRRSIKDVMVKIIPLVPDISQNLMDLVDKSCLPATSENIDKLITKVERLKVNSNTTLRKRIKDSKQITIADYNKNVNQAMELLKNIAINEKSESISSDKLTQTEKTDILQDRNKTSEISDDKKSKRNQKAVEVLTRNTENVSTSIDEAKTTQNRCTKLVVNSEIHAARMTRSSLKKFKEKPL